MLSSSTITVKQGIGLVESRPLGVIFCIEPWNFPYYQIAQVVGPNLMAGNVVVLKHAPSVPQCALAFAEALCDAGVPSGVYTNIFVSNDQAARVIADDRVRAVALTGSERAGAAVAAAAGKALKKSTMELGGSDAFIVLEDADIETAVGLAVKGRMMNTGQSCAGSKRFIVLDAVADAFIERFAGALAELRPGDPMDAQTMLGPLFSRQALIASLEQIHAAVAAGAKVRLGGRRIDRSGFFIEPTILTEVSPRNPVFHQEFFAPVAMMFRVKNEDEAIALANDSPFGLGGTIVTGDPARGRRVADRMDTGMLFINSTVVSTPELPFGGVRNSGFGRELSDLGISEFINKKLVFTHNGAR